MDNDDLKIGANPIIINDKNQILLGRRLKKVGYGTYCLPGGHVKINETVEESVVREVKEETDLDVKIEDVQVINFARTKDYINIGVLVKKYEGIPKIMEPHKCDDLSFFDLNDLPELFKNNEVNIKLYLENKFYDKDINIV